MSESIHLESNEIEPPLKKEVFSFDWEKISESEGANMLLDFLERFKLQLAGDPTSDFEKNELWESFVKGLVILLERLDYNKTDDPDWLIVFKVFECMHDFPHPQYFLNSIDLVERLPKEKINVLALLGMADAFGKTDDLHPDEISEGSEDNRVLVRKALILFDQWKGEGGVENIH